MNRDELLGAAMLSLQLGMERNAAHAKQNSHRPLSEDYEALGIFGECKFGWEFGLPVDKSLRIGGDNGIDFYTLLGTIDVKTARKPFNLLVEESKIVHAADILVLCEFKGFTVEPKLLGWECRETLAAAPTRDFGKGVIDHYIPAECLYPMEQLRQLLRRPISYRIFRCDKHRDYYGEQCPLCSILMKGNSNGKRN